MLKRFSETKLQKMIRISSLKIDREIERLCDQCKPPFLRNAYIDHDITNGFIKFSVNENTKPIFSIDENGAILHSGDLHISNRIIFDNAKYCGRKCLDRD